MEFSPRRRVGRSKRGGALRYGTAAVEFALVAPCFFMIVFGMIELGRAIMIQQVLINASRVGARQAAMLSSSQADVVAAVTDYLTGVGVSGVTTTVTPDPGPAEGGTSITVTTAVEFASVTWLPSPWFMGGKNLTSSAVMRKEGF
jgi:Flp pilus assembly protein TadG